jgi:hypothetical protein
MAVLPVLRWAQQGPDSGERRFRGKLKRRYAGECAHQEERRSAGSCRRLTSRSRVCAFKSGCAPES